MDSTLQKRLSIIRDDEFRTLLSMFKSSEMPEFNAGMTDHFRIAKEKQDGFFNHPKVLGISVGGTNTKVILASMKNGELEVHHASAVFNPPKRVHVYEFFNSILLGDAIFADYLRNTAHPVVGISVPTRVLGKIPLHETKVPTIDGLLARNESQMTEEYDLNQNFAKYLDMHNLPKAVFFYQADGIVAHHGAVSLCDMDKQDSSTLFVCGTGMATGDEESYIQVGIARMLDVGDEELFPAQATENYQFHYATAGKGIFSLMNRAIRIRSAEKGSALAQYDLSSFFADNSATKTVSIIWKTSFGEKATGDAEKIQAMVSIGAYKELEALAGWIMSRCVHSMANTVVSTITKMGRAPSGRGHIVFFEGSIANDTYANSLLRQEIKELVEKKEIYVSPGFEKPFLPNMDARYHRIIPVMEVARDEIKNIDLTVIGAATMAMAENIRELG
jgi:hypothetical protein